MKKPTPFKDAFDKVSGDQVRPLFERADAEIAALHVETARLQAEVTRLRACVRVEAEETAERSVNGPEVNADLAKRAVACKGWRWLPGMQCDLAVVLWPEESGAYVFDGNGQERSLPRERLSPRLHAPATLGCLLALVREAWGPTYMLAWHDGPDVKAFAITRTDGTTAFRITGGSLVGSLVLALEAAP